jgi:hypothetical protein
VSDYTEDDPQKSNGDEGTEERPDDLDWEENEPSPHQGEEGQEPA